MFYVSSGASVARNSRCPATRRDQLVASLADGQDAHREIGRAGVGEGAQPSLHVGFRAQRRDVADVRGVTVLEQPLVIGRVLGVAEDAVRPLAGRVHLVGAAEPDRYSGDDAGRRPARAGGRLRDAGHDVFGDRALVRHPQNGAVGTLPGDPEHHRAERGEQHGGRRDIRDIERIVNAEALVLHIDRARSREHRVEHVEIVLDHLRRTLVRQTEHAVDHPVVRRPDAETEPTAAHRLHRQRLLAQRHRMARLQRDDRGAELDPLRLAPHQRDRGHRVEVLRDLRDPRGREAGLVCLAGIVAEPVDLACVVAALRPDHDPNAHAGLPTGSRDRRRSAPDRADCRSRTRRCGA